MRIGHGNNFGLKQDRKATHAARTSAASGGQESDESENRSSSLRRLPITLSILWSICAVVSIVCGQDKLKTAVILAGIAVNVIGIAVATVPFLNSIFWMFNTLEGFIVPIAFQLLDYILKTVPAGDPTKMVDAIDAFAWNGNIFMNVGDVKGAIVDEVIGKTPIKTFVEFGAHIGYSTLRFSRLLPASATYYSVDPEPMGHAVKVALLAHANIKSHVVPVYDYSDNFLHTLAEKKIQIDFLFIDHVKGLYLRDLKLALALGLLKPGTIVVADNVLTPGAPEYRNFVESDSRFETTAHHTLVEYHKNLKDIVLVSVYKGEVSF